jgi:TIR domain-containing protein
MLFISHSSVDGDFAAELLKELTGIGVELWLDQQQIGYGVPIASQISAGLARADRLLVVWSQDADSSVHVQNEIDAFYMKSPKPGTILFLRRDGQPIPILYAARRFLSSTGDPAADATVIKKWVTDTATPEDKIGKEELPSEQSVSGIPKGPRVPHHFVSDALISAYAELLPTDAKSRLIIDRAIRMRLQADPDDPRATVIAFGDLPNLNFVGAKAFWQEVFLQAALHGPRMLASLLLAQPDDLFPPTARLDRARLLLYLRTGIKPELQE